jgi:integrase/recombinase XerD
VLGDYGAVVAPAERYLAYLSALEQSPNTVRAYAVSLRMWFEFLTLARVVWADASPEDVARFVAWLQSPGGERDRAGDRGGAVVGSDGEPALGGGVRLL